MSVHYGLILPHFGVHSGRGPVLDGARLAEELGFDSVWVRDNLFVSPQIRVHGGVEENGDFLEAMVTLSHVSAVTERIGLGTAVLVPHRHPMKLAQELMSLDALSDGRVMVGVGFGADPLQFEALGLRPDDRARLLRDTVDVLRHAWSGEPFSYEGELTSLRDVRVRPKASGQLRILMGGERERTVQFAASQCDGWLPSRLTFPALADKLDSVRKQVADRPDFVFGAIPLTRVASSKAEALSKLNAELMLAEARRRARNDDLQMEDLRGFAIWGTPDDVARDVAAYRDLGLGMLIFDLRASFAEFDDQVRRLAGDVLHLGRR